MTEALFYTRHGDTIWCGLCPHGCRIPAGRTGLCGVRVNRSGVLYADGYGMISACALDPIEKKPLYHFHPGSKILSVGSVGCNFRCAFCQNHTISATDAIIKPGTDWQQSSPRQIVSLAEHLISEGNIGVAYTYNEPLIGYEFVRDCAALAHEKGLLNVVVTNGFIAPEPLAALLPLIDAFNIDLKGFTDRFYDKAAGGKPCVALDAVKAVTASAARHAHVEITTLVIPGENDNDAEIDALARFVAGVSETMPLHLSRFFPRHRMTDKSPTPKETILRLKAVAQRHLHFVYAGNMH